MIQSRPFASALLLTLTGCATVPTEAGFDDVRSLASERGAPQIFWDRGAPEDARAHEKVGELLASPLTVDAAVQVALLENRGLQGTYERLGIAQAELVQAGLLHNPVFVGQARFPDRSPSGTNLEFSVVQDFLDLLMRSARTSIAGAQFEETKLSVAAAVIDFAAQVRSAYYAALGAQQVAGMRKVVVESAQTSAELAHRLHEAGNLSDRQLANELGLYESARVAWARADADRLAAREKLTVLLGLWGPQTGWTLPGGLPDVPATEVSLATLESDAITQRLDLTAARKESEVLAAGLGITRDWRFLAGLNIGVDAERDTDGQWVTGPEISLELPVFDQRQAAIAKLAAELRQADDRVMALAVEIRSEVRAARDRLVALRRLVEHYREVVIPLREATVGFTQEEHNYMLIGAFELIAAKQAEYDAYQNYTETVRDYWIARSDLERAVGGRLSRDDAPGPESHDHHQNH